MPTRPQKAATIPPIFPPYLQPKRKRRKNQNHPGTSANMGLICETGEERLPSLPPMLLRPTSGGAILGVLLWQPPIRTYPPIILPRKTRILPGTRKLAATGSLWYGQSFTKCAVQMLLYYPVRSDPKKKEAMYKTQIDDLNSVVGQLHQDRVDKEIVAKDIEESHQAQIKAMDDLHMGAIDKLKKADSRSSKTNV